MPKLLNGSVPHSAPTGPQHETRVGIATLTEVLVMPPLPDVSCHPEHVAFLLGPHLLI